MKKLTIYLTCIVLSVLILSGCKTQLDPNGIYKSDAYLYNIDSTVLALYDISDAFVTWEYQNNDYLKTNSPVVFNLANQVRKNMPNILKNIKTGRDLYVKYLGNTNESLSNIATAQAQLNSAVEDLQLQANTIQSVVTATPIANSYTNVLTNVVSTTTTLP